MFTQPFVQAQIKENIEVPRSMLCEASSPVTGEFYSQKASNAEDVSLWWRHHGLGLVPQVSDCDNFSAYMGI